MPHGSANCRITRLLRVLLVSTHAHLLSLGVRDAHLAWLAERLGMPEETGHPHAHHNMTQEVETAIH